MNESLNIAIPLGGLGQLSLSVTVLVTWGMMLGICVFAAIVRSRLTVRHPGGVQSVIELGFQTLSDLIREIVRSDPEPYFPLALTLFVFIFIANIAGMVPGLSSPTADIGTTAALAVVVFVSVPVFGIRAKGIKGYLGQYLKPSPIVLPFTLLGEITRTLALAVRLFGNIMSGQYLLGVIIMVLARVLKGAALVFLPVGFALTLFVSLLSLISAIIQPMIFTILALVYIGAAVERKAVAQVATSGDEGDSDGH